MTTLQYTQAQSLTNEYNLFKDAENVSELTNAKFDSVYQEQLGSPNSTEYTDDLSDAPLEVQRNNSDSRFYEEISSFEPFVELSSPITYEFKITSQTQSPVLKPIIIESHQTTDDSSKLESDETSSIDEEAEVLSASEFKNWNEKKDKILKNLAAKCKYDWKKIAKKFNATENTEITPCDLKQKYKELTKVSIPLRVKFTHQEDLMIAKFFDLYGCDWTQIASHFTDRTAMMLKNRYYSHIRKRNLLSSMLEEVQGVSYNNQDAEEEKNEVIENTEYFCDFSFENLSMRTINSAFIEFEDPFNNVLHERITAFEL